MMDYLAISLGGNGVLTMLLVAAMWSLSRRVSRMDARYDDRTRRLEDAVIRAPTREDVTNIDVRLDKLVTEQAVVVARLEAVSSSAERIENFLYQRGARHD